MSIWRENSWLLMDSDRSAVFYRSPGDEYPLFVRARGCRLWDDAGHELVDLTSGVSGAAIIGQGREDVARAMAEQVRRVSYMHTVAGTNLAQEQLAARLADLAPEGTDRVMFSSGAARPTRSPCVSPASTTWLAANPPGGRS